MRILHLSSHDISGGAARAAYRLHLGLKALNQRSQMLVASRSSCDPDVHLFQPGRSLGHRIQRRWRTRRLARSLDPYRFARPQDAECFSDDRAPNEELAEQVSRYDVINLHWVAGFLDYQSFFARLPSRIPVVWTLHDMNIFTGGCHYDFGCGKFREQCGACPQLGSHDEADLSRAIWLRKSRVFSRVAPRSFHVVADSHWLAREATRSSLLRELPVTTIHYGIDVETFAPRNKGFARALLGIPSGARVVLFAAAAVGNRRKGFSYLVSALENVLRSSDLFLLCFGRGTPVVNGGRPGLHLGLVNDDRYMSAVYSAADVFVMPSLQEAFGQTALEAMACGTPVVGFDVGGIPDIVQDGITGRLVPVGDSEALGLAIKEVLDAPDQLALMSANARRQAVEQFALEVQARNYLDLYKVLLGGKPSRSLTAGGVHVLPGVVGHREETVGCCVRTL